MSNIELKLFLDESGKKEKPTLMGGLVIAKSVYDLPAFISLSQELKDDKLSLHWTDYAGFPKKREDIIRVMKTVMNYQHLLAFNVIMCHKPNDCDNSSFRKLFYTKLPERLFYGLLRGYGKGHNIKADITIEYANEYQKENLDVKVREQLNVQAIYRGENYEVHTSALVKKGQEIGLESTDLILGIIRTILKNRNEAPLSKGELAKNELVYELLQDNNFLSFLSNIRIYEWTSSRDLEELKFVDHIRIFLSSHLPSALGMEQAAATVEQPPEILPVIVSPI